MKKKAIVIPELKGKNILIIGTPASGKTHLAKQLSAAGTHTVIHTDDYQEYGFKESLYELLNDVKKTRGATIIEGVLGYRLLRKGVQFETYYPDIVIELEVSEERMVNTYLNERPGKDLKSLKAFNKMHNTILSEYKALAARLPKNRRPLWVKLQNSY